MIPRVGERWNPLVRYKFRPGAYAILARRNKVLLTHQARPVAEFQLPGGGIDPGEQTIPALHREIEEETGWRASHLRRIGAFRRFTFMPEYDLWAEKICHIYLGRPVFRKSAPKEVHHTAHWLDAQLAIQLVGNDGDRLFLNRIFG